MLAGDVRATVRAGTVSEGSVVMSWQKAERASLAASAGMLAGCAAIGFKWVASPYLKGYASAAGGLFVFSRLAASFR